MFLNPKEADFLSLLSSSPWIPQSSFPSGEPQSERWDIGGGEFAATNQRSMKLWLRLANADDLEFITACATAADESKPYDEGFLIGEDGRFVG